MSVPDSNWQILTLPDNTWLYLTVCSRYWEYPKVPDRTWKILTVPGCTWQYVALPDSTWQYLAVPDSTWQYQHYLTPASTTVSPGGHVQVHGGLHRLVPRADGRRGWPGEDQERPDSGRPPHPHDPEGPALPWGALHLCRGQWWVLQAGHSWQLGMTTAM